MERERWREREVSQPYQTVKQARQQSDSKQKRTDRRRRGEQEGVEGFLETSNPLLSSGHIVANVNLGLNEFLLQIECGHLGLDGRAVLLLNGLTQVLVGLFKATADGVQIFELLGRSCSHVSAQGKQTDSNKR